MRLLVVTVLVALGCSKSREAPRAW